MHSCIMTRMTSGALKGEAPRGLLKAHGLDPDEFIDILLDTTTDGVAAVSVDGIVLFANRAAQEGLDVRPGATLSESVPEMAAVVERSRAQEGACPIQFLHRGPASWLTKVSAIRGQDGLIGTLCAFVDITDSELTARQLQGYQELTREQD